jgi:hypothetical protein
MLSRIQLLKFAAAGGVIVCTLGSPARADEFVQNLGPVGPHEAILGSCTKIATIPEKAPPGRRRWHGGTFNQSYLDLR